MENSSLFWILVITEWWQQQEETDSKYTNLSMWRVTYSLPYHMVSEWRPGFPLGKMLLAGGSQKPQARACAKKSLYGRLLERISGFWQALTPN